MILLFAIFLLGCSFLIYQAGKLTAVWHVQKKKILLATQAKYYGYYALSLSYTLAFFIILVAVVLFRFDILISSKIQLFIINIFIVSACAAFALYKIEPTLKAQRLFERNIKFIMMCISSIAFIITVMIICSIIFETYKFFQTISIIDFFTSLTWSPQDNLQDPNLSKKFGIIPLLSGTLLITIIALIVSAPAGILAAVFLSEYVSTELRFYLKPIIEMLSGVPTVVYGYFAALYMGPYIRQVAEGWGFVASSESALAAGVVLGIMIIPYIISLSDDVFKSIPVSIKDASLALGATKFETIARIVVPAAKSGLIGSVMLAFSRAIGETMIVTMASGLTARLTANPFQSVTTVTAQIVSILTGDQEFGSVKTLAAFALAFSLFCITLFLNIIAQNVINKSKRVFR